MAATRAWDETKPAGPDYVSEGDDEIRATKVDIRERLALEHIWNVNVTDDGLHKDGSARIQSGTDATKPASPKLNQLYYATDTYKLYHCKTAGSWTDITAEFAGFVRLSGAQTIADVKTFDSIPVLPATNPTADNEASRKAYVDSYFPVVEANIGASVVSQTKLKTTTGEVSTTMDGANDRFWGIHHRLSGGTYAPRVVLCSVVATVGENCLVVTLTLPGGEYGFYPNGYTSGTNSYFKQRYITTSGKDHWIFLLVDKETNQIISSYQALDHPCANQSRTTELDIPHPFGSYNPEKYEVVVVDNDILAQLKTKLNRRNSLLSLINEQCLIDDTKRPKYEPREIIKINEYPSEPIGETIARIKTPQWAKIMINQDEITLEQRIVEKLPDYMLYKKIILK